MENSSKDLNEAISSYYMEGYTHAEIVEMLETCNKTCITKRQLKYRLWKLNLSRRNHLSDAAVTNLVQQELSNSRITCRLGYRALWTRLKMNHHHILLRRQVQSSLSRVDPEGVAYRSRRRFKRGCYRSSGPNDTWHLDGNDKLAPWGLYIHGCIDGFSRKIMWLKAANSNKSPSVVAYYYTEAVKQQKGCPMKVRMDAGTENSTVANIHAYFRQTQTMVLIGKSTGNQRIEQFWSTLLKQLLQWWRDAFSALQYEGFYDGSLEDKYLVRFCFLNVLQDQLHTRSREWDCHRIRRQPHLLIPQGIPNILYHLPHLYGRESKIHAVTDEYLDNVMGDCSFPLSVREEETTVHNYIKYIMVNQNLTMSTNSESAMQLYRTIYPMLHT